MKSRAALFLSTLPDVSGLPTEFRIFRKGENPSTKGSVWFDDVAAALVMAAALKWGNQFAVDLEHHSLLCPDARPDAPDARGYFRPEIRNGELWAVGVTWTADGAERLRSRKQRYMSPAFNATFDPTLCGGRGGRRVTELLNVGLVAQPASDHLEALVASKHSLDVRSATGYGTGSMQPTQLIQAALDALSSGDVAAATALLTQCLAAEPAEAEAPEAPPVVASEAPPPPAEEEPKPDEMQLSRLAADAAELAAFRAERDARDTTERRSLIIELVSLGAETPVTAWSNNAPVARLASEPLADLRSRVTVLRSSRTKRAVAPGVGELDGLTEAEQNQASKITDPTLRSRFIAVRKSRKPAL